MAAHPRDQKEDVLKDIAHKMACIERYAATTTRKRQVAEARQAVGRTGSMSLEQLKLLQISLRVLDQQIEAEAMFP